MTLSIRNCPFAFRCDRKWSALKRTADPDVRFCGDCQREVYRCHTDRELVEAVALNRCVTIQVDEYVRGPEGVTMGYVAPPPYGED